MLQIHENPQSGNPADYVVIDMEMIQNLHRAIDDAMCLLAGAKEKLAVNLPMAKEATDSPETQIRCRVVRAEDLNTDFALTPSPSTAQDRRLADPRRNGTILPNSIV